MAENELRQGLRESGLAWIVEEVDEGLTRIASNEDKPPSAETRIAALIDAMVLAFELAENTADGVSSLLGPEDAPADRLSAITAIEFVDPLGREATRTLSRDRKMGEDTMNLLRARAEELRAAIQGNSLQ
jgi:hypothetical protein